MKRQYHFIVLLISIFFASACRTTKNNETIEMETGNSETIQHLTASRALPKVYVYKTKGDYFDRVPVIMNTDRSTIISYPAPGDLHSGGKLATPTRLVDGYLLDNRGIGINVVFLKYTYEEYSKLPSAPTLDDMMLNILDKHPLLELYECGKRADYKNIESELNVIVKAGFPTCKRIF